MGGHWTVRGEKRQSDQTPFKSMVAMLEMIQMLPYFQSEWGQTSIFSIQVHSDHLSVS